MSLNHMQVGDSVILGGAKFKKGDKVLTKNRRGKFEDEGTIQGETRKNPNNIGVLDYLVGHPTPSGYVQEIWIPEFNIKKV